MFSLVLSLALAASTAAESDAATAKPATETAAKPAKPKSICRVTKMTGSNLGRRVCKTEDQWLAADTSAPIDAISQGYKQNVGVGSTALSGPGGN